ncbi:hypothetical protein KM043_013761 [Ampulex compressa]|nr:hypothetical protein KM043_013761 [Ampulex compressa]
MNGPVWEWMKTVEDYLGPLFEGETSDEGPFCSSIGSSRELRTICQGIINNMDRRKLKSGGSLHKNLGSQLYTQVSTKSNYAAKSRTPVDEPTPRKRKSLSVHSLQIDSDDDSDLPLNDYVASKKRRQEKPTQQKVTQEVSDDALYGNPSRTKSVTPRKTLSVQEKSPSKSLNRTVSSEKKCDNISRILNVTQLDNADTAKELLLRQSQSSQRADKLASFLKESGITLCPGGPHILDKDLQTIKRNVKELLNSEKFEKNEIISLVEKHIDNEENLQTALNDMEVADNELLNVLNRSSLIKVLLEIPRLQPEIHNSLLNKLNEAVLLADSMDDLPWGRLLLHQFRYLETIISPDSFTSSLEQLLESCPVWFQRELIVLLPDIVTDKQHQKITEILSKLLEETPELTSLILDCLSNLNLGTGYMEEYREKILNLLKTNLQTNIIPAALKFIFDDSTSFETFKKTLHVLRNVDMQPLVGENLENCYKNQADIVNIIKMNILVSKNMSAILSVIKSVTKDPKPFDIILLLLIHYTTPMKQKNVENLLRSHIRSGFYRPSLFQTLYNNYKEVVKQLQPVALQLSGALLKSDERVFIDFAIEWFRLQFITHKDAIFKQREIVEYIVLLMGDNDQTAKNALQLLRRITMQEDERECLELHCNHLRVLLEKLDHLELEEVGALNDILHNLCISSTSESESLRDDLFILIQKQICGFKPLTKCRGVMGAVMAIKHMASKTDLATSAMNLFKKVLKSVKNCQQSQALFYDQLSDIIMSTESISTEFLQSITICVEEEFINSYMIDKSTYSGELTPQFGLNNAEEEPQNCVLNFGNGKTGSIVPISFRLLKTCCIRLSQNGELEAIDALLGCAILMPESYDIAEPYVLDLVICCINWFREVIGGFVTQTDVLLQKQILQRLDNLIYLQDKLNTLLSLCDVKYQPSPCYFHHATITPFIKSEKKTIKKGKKKTPKKVANERESWELGATLCSRNPMYFRKLDAKISHLLGIRMELHTSQSRTNITMLQVCFISKELLELLDHEPSETFIRDIIHLLPKVCLKLQDVVQMLREVHNDQTREAARLLLSLLTKIFSWKGFHSVTFNALLREGLRTLAAQMNEANAMLRSCKELVAEAYKYFESLSDIATHISLAITLINLCQALMKHSATYSEQHKDKHAKLAYAFLSLQWPEDKHISPQYKAAVNGLLNNWIDNEPMPLTTVSTVLEWLPDDVLTLEKTQDTLSRLPSIKKNNFYLLYKKIFEGLIKGVKISLETVNTDPERVEVWQHTASNINKLVKISKQLKAKNIILIFLKYMPTLLRFFLNVGMPVLEYNLKYQTEEITGLLKQMQGGTRYLHTICCDSTEKKDTMLAKYVPIAKSALERLLYSVKGMLVLNNSPAAFWMGNLVNKDLEGHEILSQKSTSEEITLPDMDKMTDDNTNISSEILDTDSEESDSAEKSDDMI